MSLMTSSVCLGKSGESRDCPWRATLALAFLAFLCYFPATRCGFTWDDDYYVQNNVTLRSTDGLRRIWTDPRANSQYYPLVYTSYWIECRLWGPNPRPMHVLNILLHSCSAILLWRILLALRVPWPWLAAAVFALHPVTVESVAWIAERKNTLSTVFSLASMLAFIRFSNSETAPRRALALYGLSFGLFICALLSKTVTASLPAALLVIMWWKRDKVTVKDILFLLPFFVIGTGMGLVTVWLEQTHVGASGHEWQRSFLENILVAGRVSWFYASKLVLPVGLSFIYPRWTIDAHDVWQYLYPAGLVALLATLYLGRGRLGKGPFAAAVLFVGTLFPVLGFINVYPMRYSFVADHFQYLAAPAMLALIVCVAMSAARTVAGTGVFASRIVPGAALMLLGALTWDRCGVYSSQEALWLDTLRKNPACWLAWNNLGRMRQIQGRIDDALVAYERALRLYPAEALHHFNMGNALLVKQRYTDAQRYLEEAVALQPEYVPAHLSLANTLKAQGSLARAIDEYRAALRISDAVTPAHFNLANTLASLGRTDEAIAHYRRTLELDPSHAAAHFYLAMSLPAADLAERIAHLKEACRLQPDWAQACAELTRALAIHPDPGQRVAR
jgi:protein O-mannosyl-transferase